MAFDLGFFSSQRETNTRSGVSRTLAAVAIVAAGLAGADAFTVSPLAASRCFVPATQTTSSQLLACSLSLRGSPQCANGLKPTFARQLRAASSTSAPVDNKKMYEIAHENFARWNNALQEKSFEKTAALYSKSDLSFLPTVSPEHIKDPLKTKQYFVEFIKKNPAGEITDDTVQALSEESYLHTGMYTFMTGPENDRQPVNARFSYLWKKFGDEWKICHHHSSAVPGSANSAPEVTGDDLYPTAQANFQSWNGALQAKDYDKVASLYSSTDLSFLPTVSPEFIRDKHSTKEYFVNFIKKQPVGTITSDKVQAYGPGAYLHTGMYTFLTGPEDARVPVEARFSYMWRKIDGEWKIVHHHSSAVPKAPEAAVEEVKSEAMYPIAQENFAKWNGALKKKDYKKVASLYSTKNLSFLPTVSPEFIRDGDKTQDYFIEFVKKQPEGTITSDDVQAYGPDAYLHTGMYTFMTGPSNNRQPVRARFSYMWRKVDGAWKIVHHHSSAVPTPAPEGKSKNANTSKIDLYPVAQSNFKAWNDGLKAKDFEAVAGMYCTEELSFLPTVSPKFIRDGPSTKEYFVKFLKKLPEGTITADDVQPYGDDAYLHSGMYTFMTGPEDDRQPVNARFSYMWKKKDGQWKIVHHHSSALPQGADGSVPQGKAKEVPEFDLTTREDDIDPEEASGPLEIAPFRSMDVLARAKARLESGSSA